MTPGHHLARWYALPELKFMRFRGINQSWFELEMQSESRFRACPKCQQISQRIRAINHRF